MLIINLELKELIPPLQLEEYKLLEKSIIEEGCRDSLVIWGNTIIDGHNRYEICNRNNIEFSTKEMSFENINDVKLWMIKNQFARRNLPMHQRSLLVFKSKPIIAERAKENLRLSGGDKKSEEARTGLQNSVEPIKPIDTQKELAQQAKVSHDTIWKVEKIFTKKPELIEKMDSGEMSINQAYQEIKKEEKKQELIQKKEEYNTRVKQAITEEKFNKIDIFNTEKKFRIIYADPCWSYNDKQNTEKLGGAAKHYDTMSIRELSELPVKNIIEDNAVLFLWVTSPLLEESFEVIKGWGFKYKTSFIWDKVDHNMGHYNSVRHEFLLIATKGSCTPDNKVLYNSVQRIVRTEHSAKPKEFMNIIDDLYVYGDRLEMFAREKHKDSWLYWGNEA